MIGRDVVRRRETMQASLEDTRELNLIKFRAIILHPLPKLLELRLLFHESISGCLVYNLHQSGYIFSYIIFLECKSNFGG